MNGIPMKPMHRILCQYVSAKNLPFDMKRWEGILQAMKHYSLHARYLN